jgi:hypothetical protein
MEVIQRDPRAQLILVGGDVPDVISGSEILGRRMMELFTRSFVGCKLSRRCALFSSSSAYY